MLCSLPNAKSSSTWLDRLHTLRGFNNPSPSPSLSAPNPNPNPNPNPDPLPQNTNLNSTSPSNSSQIQPLDVMSNILADLFVMDPPDPAASQTLLLKPGAKRGLRKQPTPKICIFSNAIKSSSFPPSANAGAGALEVRNKKRNNKLKVIKKNKQVKDKSKKEKKRIEAGLGSAPGSNSSATGSKVCGDMKGRTEATVIDTSTPGWKSAKILIRKGSIWKIRDKKQWNAGLSKRKGLNHASNKEKELLKSEKPSDPLDQGDNHEEPIDATQVPVKRPKCSKLPSIPEAAKSIALHLKVRTNGKKKGLSSNSSLKENVQP